jgi:prepilin-type processing-associated H-X9-DG protein
MMTAVLSYCQDYDEAFPLDGMYQGTSASYPGPPFWDVLLQPYIKNTQIYRCPSAAPVAGGGDRDYRYNSWLGGSGNGNLTGPPYNMAKVTTPVAMVVFCDIPTGCTQNTLSGWSVRSDGDVIQTHNSGDNIGFADGHSKWIGGAPTALYTYGWMTTQGYVFQ